MIYFINTGGRPQTWLTDLAKRRDLFDGITVHDYSLQDYYFKHLSKEVWPTLMAAFPEGLYQVTEYLSHHDCIYKILEILEYYNIFERGVWREY